MTPTEPYDTRKAFDLSTLDVSIYDRSWGVGGWVIHFGCPGNETGLPYVIHSVKFHEKREQ